MNNSYRFFENKECKYYPCHQNIENVNCLFCYCPMYNYENCLGNNKYIEKNGKRIKVCTDCTFPHKADNYDKVIEFLRQQIK